MSTKKHKEHKEHIDIKEHIERTNQVDADNLLVRTGSDQFILADRLVTHQTFVVRAVPQVHKATVVHLQSDRCYMNVKIKDKMIPHNVKAVSTTMEKQLNQSITQQITQYLDVIRAILSDGLLLRKSTDSNRRMGKHHSGHGVIIHVCIRHAAEQSAETQAKK